MTLDSEYNKILAEELVKADAQRDFIPMSVIEDIKKKIKAKASEHIKFTDYGRREDGLYEALEIIDKHIGKAESEDKDEHINENR